MICLSKSLACLTACVLIASVPAIAADAANVVSLKKIAEETAALNSKKEIIFQKYQTDAKSCWQLFAVNDCLAKAKRQKYQALAPLEQLESVLNAKRRELKEADRVQRLMDKTLSPLNASDAIKVSP
jgi:thioester reductase-like protein